MHYRLNNKAIVLSALLLCIVGAVFAYTFFSHTTTPQEPIAEPEETREQTVTPDVISAKQYIEGDLHTIAGTVRVPSACHSVSVVPFMNDASGTQVELRFSLVLGEGDCPQAVSDATFKVTFNAQRDARITATWNGLPVTLNLVPAESGESLDKEFYFKG